MCRLERLGHCFKNIGRHGRSVRIRLLHFQPNEAEGAAVPARCRCRRPGLVPEAELAIACVAKWRANLPVRILEHDCLVS